MNIDQLAGATPPRDVVPSTIDLAESALMVCEVCDLVGGPFAPAEAAHLRAVHDRLHHGVLIAA